MNFKDFLNERKQPTEVKELKDIIKNKENPGDYWSEFIVVDGISLFDTYMDFLEWVEKHTEVLKPDSWEETIEDEEEGDYEETITRELQESYLGYVPSKDIFITGYDMWEGDENPAGIAIWKLKNGKFKLIDEDIKYTSDMMYGSRGHYTKLHKQYKDLVDIRLD